VFFSSPDCSVPEKMNFPHEKCSMGPFLSLNITKQLLIQLFPKCTLKNDKSQINIFFS
jgi:hypothetical protein